MAFLRISMYLFFKKYYLYVRNAVLAVCAKPVPVSAKEGNERAVTGRKVILTCHFDDVCLGMRNGNKSVISEKKLEFAIKPVF